MDPQAEAGVGEAAGEDGVKAELLVRLVRTAGLPWQEIFNLVSSVSRSPLQLHKSFLSVW